MFSSYAICSDGSQFGSTGAKMVASEFSASLRLIFLNADYPFFFSAHTWPWTQHLLQDIAAGKAKNVQPSPLGLQSREDACGAAHYGHWGLPTACQCTQFGCEVVTSAGFMHILSFASSSEVWRPYFSAVPRVRGVQALHCRLSRSVFCV